MTTDHLARLTDRQELTDLVSRVGACLDEHRFDDLRALLADDATARTPGGTAVGGDEVAAQAARSHDEYPRLQHLLTNVLVDLADDGTATVRANLVARLIRDGSTPALDLGAVYRAGARRTADGWRIGSLEIDPVWRVDGPVVAAVTAPVAV